MTKEKSTVTILSTVQTMKEPNNDEVEDLKSGTFPESLKGRVNVEVKTNFKKQRERFVIVNNMLHYKYRQIMKVVTGPETLCVIKNQSIPDQYKKSTHEGLGTTAESKALGGHLGRDKTLWK